jgi:hypothetical protein
MLLAQPGRIGALTLKNRVIMAPMGTNYSTTDGLSTERDKLYYALRAEGGVAAIMTEAMVVTEQARPHHNSLCVYHDRFIPGLASIVEAFIVTTARLQAAQSSRGVAAAFGTEHGAGGPLAWQNRIPVTRCARCGWTGSRNPKIVRCRCIGWCKRGYEGGDSRG